MGLVTPSVTLNFGETFTSKEGRNIKMYLSMKGCLLAYIKLRDFLEKISQPETVEIRFLKQSDIT